ncbi:type II toxin-antitoxin system VapC family toxin [Pseudonocardia nematodicida]|uniref:Ribonuclease VapC n=1 Tax=Pseudonocardia nematodicida TaxID=1206997 RepID=A0ABV1KHM7_9PSEU
MIIIDTNVVSEMMRGRPDPGVLAWVNTAGRLHTTAVTLAEVEYGIARLPVGHRKDRLAEIAEGLFDDFRDVILSFDASAAHSYASIAARREKSGRPIAAADAQIAAICASREATLATRNIADFECTGVTVINPWG